MAYRRRGIGSYVSSVPCATGLGPGAKAAGMSGLGCPDCGGTCNGMGAWMDGTGLLGTGLFAGGLDPSTWGAGEYVAVAAGLYVLFSVFSQTKRTTRTTRRVSAAMRKAIRSGNI